MAAAVHLPLGELATLSAKLDLLHQITEATKAFPDGAPRFFAILTPVYGAYQKDAVLPLESTVNVARAVGAAQAVALKANPMLREAAETLSGSLGFPSAICSERCGAPIKCNDACDQALISETVGTFGTCLVVLRALFDVAMGEVRERYSVASADNGYPSIVFCTEKLRGNGPNKHYAIDGYTTESSDEHVDAEVRQTRLRVSSHTFCEREYFGALYVLFHELVAHAMDSLPLRKKLGSGAGQAGDMFAEGWMDYVAERVMDNFLSRQDVGLETPSLMGFPAYRTEDFRAHGINLLTGCEIGDSLRPTGRRAASFLRGLLQRSTGNTADDVFVGFSLWVNRSDLNWDDRDALVQGTYEIYVTNQATVLHPWIASLMLQHGTPTFGQACAEVANILIRKGKK